MNWLEQAKLYTSEGDAKTPDADKKKARETKAPQQKKDKEQKPGNLGLTISASKDDTLATPDKSRQRKSRVDFVEAFTEKLLEAGFILDEPVCVTGDTPKRCDIEGCKRGSKPGWYFFKVVRDFAFGAYGDWREGGHHTWSSFDGDEPVDARRMQQIREELDAARRKAEAEREKLRLAAINFVRSKIAMMDRERGTSKYLELKKIQAITNSCLLYRYRQDNEDLVVVPVYDAAGRIMNWQLIDERGNKRFKKYAPVEGHFFTIGNFEDASTVVFCEGLATGASVFFALNVPVIVCFNAGNMPKVGQVLKNAVSGKAIFIAADNDISETGYKYAKKASEVLDNAEIVMPTVVGEDFNDMWCRLGAGDEARDKIKRMFQEAGFVEPEKAEIVIWDGEAAPDKRVPAELLRAPGDKLQELVEWFEASAVKSSRQVALMGALGYACGIAGRLYMEAEMGNFSSIMACVIAPSGGGKDFVKKCINRVLVKSDLLKDIVGSSSYTSEAAIRNQLIQHPVKISVLDEFGDKMNTAIRGTGRDREAFEAFKEIYSDIRGVWAGRAYAMVDPSGNKTDMRSEPVYNPALTIIGLSTPQQFVDAITESHIEGGFLNRFIVMDASGDKVNRKRVVQRDVPAWVVEHSERVIEAARAAVGGNLADMVQSDYSREARPKEIIVSQEVSDLFWEFTCYLDEKYEGNTMMENLSSRWAENARRLCVGMAAFENPEKPAITMRMAQWAISFVQYHGYKLAELIDKYSYIDEYHRIRSRCLDIIRARGKQGMTLKDMSKVRPFNGMQIALRNKILNELESLGFIIRQVEQSKAGRSKVVYYALKVQ